MDKHISSDIGFPYSKKQWDEASVPDFVKYVRHLVGSKRKSV